MGFLVVIVIVIGLGIWASSAENKRKEEERQRKIIRDKENKKIFEQKKNQYNIKESNPIVTFTKGFSPMAKTKQYVWIEENDMCFFPAIEQSIESRYMVFRVPLKNIEYYATQGTVSKHSVVSGGGGQTGGVSLTGAVVGGVIAGGAGAVIGSRKKGKIEPIKTEIVTQDDRETFLNYYVDNEKHSLFFSYSDYNVLLKLIPDKAFDNNQRQNIIQSQLNGIKKNKIDNSELIKQIKELASLRDEGIITDDEFNEKKKVLMDNIK